MEKIENPPIANKRPPPIETLAGLIAYHAQAGTLAQFLVSIWWYADHPRERERDR